MQIEFFCGQVKDSVGMPALAIKAHLQECKNPQCVEDCQKELAKTKNVYIEAN